MDRKLFLWPLGFVIPLSALLPSQLVLRTGFEVLWWSSPIIVFVIIPIVDAIVGDDRRNPSQLQASAMQANRYYRWCTWLFIPTQLVSVAISCYLWSFGTLSLVDKLGLAVSLGLVGSLGINTAHELGHRQATLERRLSKIALAQTMYGHFFVDHNRGHHAWVATPDDPSSARLGESLYRYLPRVVIGVVTSAWALEAARLRRKHRPWWHPGNHLLNAWALTVVLFGSMVALFGFVVLPWLLLQGCVGFLVLESVNFMEHYGLRRADRPSGGYEKCTPRHSWNSDRLVTNVLLYQIQRHSDHHAHPGRRYQTLRSWQDAPQLPAGYPTMILVAMIPPLFSRLMDPRVVTLYDGDVDLANIAPTARGQRARRRHLVRESPVSRAA